MVYHFIWCTTVCKKEYLAVPDLISVFIIYFYVSSILLCKIAYHCVHMQYRGTYGTLIYVQINRSSVKLKNMVAWCVFK